MAAKKFIRLVSGILTEVFGVQTSAPPSTATHIVQRIGKATSATSADFERGIPVTLV